MDAGAYGFEHHTASDEHFPSDITSAASDYIRSPNFIAYLIS